MRIYRKLQRTWSHSQANYIKDWDKVFPELKHISSEEMCDRFIELGLDFYTEEKKTIHPMVRVTMPFALILFVLMIILMPFKFVVTGSWCYDLKQDNRILNWFKSIGIQ